MSAWRQISEVAAMGLRNVPQRPGSASVIVIGIAGVVGVLVSMLTLGASVADSMRAAGEDDRAIVLRSGIDAESESVIFPAEAQSIANAPGVAQATDGKPAATAEMLAAVNLPRQLDGRANRRSGERRFTATRRRETRDQTHRRPTSSRPACAS